MACRRTRVCIGGSVKILLDMNISPRWVHFFKTNRIEAIHWLDCGAPDAQDCEIMAHAREHDYIVFTHDLDFSTLLATSKDSKPSVIQLRSNDISPEAAGNSILAAIRQMQTQLEAGALLTIDPKRARIRLLPL